MRYIYPLIWLGLIVFASLTPSDKLPDFQLFKHADKVVHWGMYAGLTFLSIPAILRRKNYKLSYSITFFSAILIGSLMEYLQAHLSGNRSAEFSDFIANGVGVITGIVIYQLLIRNTKIEKLIFRIG